MDIVLVRWITQNIYIGARTPHRRRHRGGAIKLTTRLPAHEDDQGLVRLCAQKQPQAGHLPIQGPCPQLYPRLVPPLLPAGQQEVP